MSAVLFAATILEDGIATAVGGAAIGTTAGALAIAGTVLIILLAIVTAVLEGIRVFENASLPGKIAEYVVNARTAVTDPATLIGTTAGATSLFTMFVGATLPRPRYDIPCDNSLIPPWAYTSSFDPNLLIYVPLGQNTAITSPADRQGCLNPPLIPPVSPTDAHFLVTRRGAGSPPQVAPSINIGGSPNGTTQKVRLTGNWFVDAITEPGGGTRTWQSLSLDYIDWDGVGNVAWLLRDETGRQTFIGGQAPADGTSLDLDTCEAAGTCWESDHLEYVGTDGQRYSASIEQFQAATGTPTYAPSALLEAAPVTFSANDFEPGGSTGHLTYSWRFQPLGCGFLCFANTPFPRFDGPFTGESVSYTWQSNGRAWVELTASDPDGHSATTKFLVDVGNIAPTVVTLHEQQTVVGRQVLVQGVVGDAGAEDDLNVAVTLGDGVQKAFKVGPHAFNFFDPDITSLQIDDSPPQWGAIVRHTYTEPGYYYGTYTVSDWGGGSDFDTFVIKVVGQQEIAFPAVEDHEYGDQVAMTATGTQSGRPVTYTAAPAGVCEATGENGARIDLVGVGQCTVTAHQAEYLPVFLRADDVSRSFEVAPADLTITADNKTRVYGADEPTYTASVVGLANGDTKADLGDLTFAGAAPDAGVGSYVIAVSGATNPNYDITYATGTEKVTPARLTITADDTTRVYGEDPSTYTASYDGFVNGDDQGAVNGLQVTGGAPAGADVGDYPIQVSGATSPNYAIDFVAGTEKVTPARLTITAEDKIRVYGEDAPAYTASYDGFVNGDDQGEVTGLEITGGAPDGAAVGDYPIHVAGAVSPNYAIAYVAGTEHVTPAPLTITADDQSRVYGAKVPAYTASYDGLVNGDTQDQFADLTLTGPPTGAGVGTYAITPSGASNANYEIDYAAGTETVTPAPLTIRPANVAVGSGQTPTYSWHGDGWVNGDSDATLSQPGRTPPTCTATVGAPGEYAAAVTCSGARDPNYAIGYTAADLRVDPVLVLAQRGLPSGVKRKVYLDRSTVSLPVVARVVRLGSRHSYRFPTALLGHAGTTYVTTAQRFDGPVFANIDVTARYLTLHQLLRRAQAADRIGKKESARLDRRWDDIQALIDPRRNAKLRTALHQFADRVREQTGASIRISAAEDLVTYAQAVYRRIGGTGKV